MDNLKNRRGLVLVCAFVVLVGVALYVLLPRTPALAPLNEELLGAEPSLHLYTIGATSTGQLVVSVPFTRTENGAFFIDIAVDVNKNGQFEDEEWQVKDTPTFLAQNLKNNFWLVDTQLVVHGGDSVGVSIKLRGDTEGAPEYTRTTSVTAQSFEIGELLGYGVDGAHEDIKRGASLPSLAIPLAYAEDAPEPVFRNHNTPDLAQGPMECAAVSAANSIMSLAGEHDRLESLPKFTGELIEELKTDMQYTGKGITLPKMVAGKNAFAQRHHLPIVTTIKYAPTKADIESALRSGAAIELSFAFVQSKSGKDNTGHVMTLVGGSQSELYVHDSATPEGMDPLRMYGTVQTPKQTFINVPYPLWDGTAYIDAIVIQNWTEASHAEESYTDAGEQGSEVEMLVIDGHYFPKAHFRVGEHGACQASHYHSVRVDGMVYGLKDKQSTETVSKTDPLPDSCGFGKVSEVPVEKITVTFEQSQQLLRYLPN